MTSPLPTARSLFQEALDLPSAAARKAFLDQACQHSPELRTAVEALLTAYQSAGSFLESPAVDLQPIWSENRSTDRESDTDCGIAPPGNLPLDFLLPPREPGHLGRLAHYEVVEIIGHGGMGVVLKAIDENLQRVVAIKVLAPHLATSGSARQRFVREARAAAAVRNDHVVSIYAVEEPQGLPYLVMECIAGTTLQELLDASGALSTTEILRIGMQVAAGLTAAHAQGLIHRDIKPANILLENGVQRVKITDFGLARVADDASLTQSGVLAGTPQYMSPEQAQGLTLDTRSDLFSLGCVLYALCTGKPPFRAETTLATVRRVCEDTPHSIRDINPDVPRWLVEIVDRLLAKQPAERFQSAQEVADLLSQRLAEIQQGTLPMIVTRTRDKSDPRRGQVWRSSPLIRRWLITATAALVLLSVALSLTEASGVTHLAATIIRIFTPDGTLVVEVEDPQVQVIIEGDGGLSIKGAGPQEVRLHPGNYQVEATKDGKPVSKKLVEITRGDRKVVTVTREASGQPAGHVTAGVPQLLTPTADAVLPNGGKGISIPYLWEFAWTEVAGATAYQLQVDNDAGTMPTVDAVIRAAKKRVEFSIGYTMRTDGWHWRVRAKVNEQWGPWSEKRPFHVGPIIESRVAEVEDPSLPMPAQLAPAPGATLPGIVAEGGPEPVWEFTWQNVPGATSYQMHCMKDGSPPGWYHQSETLLVRVNYERHPRDPRVAWSWKVRAQVNGKWGPWSEPRAFHTAAYEIPPPPSPSPSGGAFVVLPGGSASGVGRTFATLADAVLKSSDGDTIEIRGNGPFTIEPIRLTSRRVIRAGTGFRPVLKINSPSTPARNAPRFLESVAPLILEGLEFQSGNPNAWSGVTTMSQSDNAQGALYVANCRFVQCGLMAQYVSACQIRNCEMYRRDGNSFGFFRNSNSLTAVIDNSIAMTGANMPAVAFGGDVTGQRINLSRNFLAGRLGLAHQVPGDKAGDDAIPVPVESFQNIWFGASGAVMFSLHSDSPIPVEWTSAARLEALLGKVFAWRENRNLYPEGVSLLSLFLAPGATALKPTSPYTTLADWNQLWGVTHTTSIQGAIHCQGGDVYQKFILAPEKLTPEDFRLQKNSAGYRAGSDGKDLGPDIDLVGPGAGYERWQKTPAYQAWLKETRQAGDEASAVVPATSPLPSAGERGIVILAAGSQAVRECSTLNEALAQVRWGDVIEFCGNGPFPLQGPNAIGVSVPLTIRAGTGSRPVIHLAPGAGLSFAAPAILEGLDFHRTARTEGPAVYSSAAASPLYIANCRFLRCGIVNRANAAELRNCQIVTVGNAITSPQTAHRLVLRDNVLYSPATALNIVSLGIDPVSIEFDHNSIVSGRVIDIDAWYSANTVPKNPLHVTARHNMACVNNGVISLRNQEAASQAGAAASPSSEASLRQSVAWKEQRNLYPQLPKFYILNAGREFVPLSKPCTTVAAWNQLWDQNDSGSLQDVIWFENQVRRQFERVRLDDQVTLEPNDFRLPPSGPGAAAEPDGRPLGANIDLVGPGAGYERWKQTPDYEAWLKTTGQKK